MKIKKIELFKLKLDFKESFKHSLADRKESTSLILKLTAQDNSGNELAGFGESIAREYLTGETFESIQRDLLKFLKKMKKSFKTFSEIKKHIKKINLKPAAKSCVDIALLNLGSEYFKEPILATKINEVHYSAPVSLTSEFSFMIKLIKIKLFGIKNVKIKMDGDVAKNEKRIKIARLILGKTANIGVDANGSWTKEVFKNMIPILEKNNLSFCEQPLSKKELFSKNIQTLTKIPIMADESFTSLSDAKKLKNSNSIKILNIRIAKLGGIIAAQDAIDFARKNNLQFQIGCLVGESGILSSAGRVLASHNTDAVSVEGSYGKYLLNHDVVKQDISFGKYGKAPVLSGLNDIYGLGIGVDEKILKDNLVLFLEK